MINPFFGQSPGYPPCECGGSSSPGMAFNFGLMTLMMSTMATLFQQCFAFAPGQTALPGSADFGGAQAGNAGNGLNGFLGGTGARAPRKKAPGAPSTSKAKPSQAGGGHLAGKLPRGLKAHAAAFEKYGKKYGVDPKFLAAISMLETGNGTSRAFRSGKNAMGVSNSSGPISFKSVSASIEHMARVLGKKNGVYGGKSTIGGIASIYCPVGAGNDVNGTNGHWPSMVSKFYKQLGGNPKGKVK